MLMLGGNGLQVGGKFIKLCLTRTGMGWNSGQYKQAGGKCSRDKAESTHWHSPDISCFY